MYHDNIASPAPDNANVDIIELLGRIRIPEAKRYISVRPVEGEFMHRWVKEHNLSRTLEIGLAHGASACSIMSAHHGTHTCMDPFQDQYGNLGLENIASLGYSGRLDFHPDYSYIVLPQLLTAQRSFDFAFIDGNHRYDSIFVDFFLRRLASCGSRLRTFSRRLDARHAIGRFVHTAEPQRLSENALPGEKYDPLSKNRAGRKIFATFPGILHFEELFLAPGDYLDDAPRHFAEAF